MATFLLFSNDIASGRAEVPDQPREGEPTLQDVMSGLALRNLSFKNAEVHVTYDDLFTPVIKGSAQERRNQTIDTIFDNSGNVYLDMIEARPGDPPSMAGKRRMTTTWNKKECRVLMPGKTDQGEVLLGRISKSGGLWWAIEPVQLCALTRWSPESYLARVRQIAMDGSELIDGVGTMRITWESEEIEPVGAARKGTFWVQPSRGYAVVRSEEYARVDPNSEWLFSMRYEWKSVKPVGYMWLPEEVRYKELRYRTDGSSEIAHELTAHFTNWKINQPLRKNAFDLEFPDKTWVTDDITDRSYRKGAINDAKLARQAAQAKVLAEEGRPAVASSEVERLVKEAESRNLTEPRASNLTGWLAAGFACVGVMAALVFWVKRMNHG
jgi:hypothetical protein